MFILNLVDGPTVFPDRLGDGLDNRLSTLGIATDGGLICLFNVDNPRNSCQSFPCLSREFPWKAHRDGIVDPRLGQKIAWGGIGNNLAVGDDDHPFTDGFLFAHTQRRPARPFPVEPDAV